MEKTTKREITTRAVLYVGYPCNLRCKFCYYAYNQDAKWHPLKETKQDASLFREKYGNDRVDITGGEPTIYPHIFELLDHCNKIGLRPTLITNMQVLADRKIARKFKKHGVYDFICSIHGLEDTYDWIVQKEGAWDNVLKAIKNLNYLNIPWRANCTIIHQNIKQLKDIAQFVDENYGRVINFIEFNPFYEWEKLTEIDFQAKHSDIAPYLREALNYCEILGLEANVRYFPFCMMKGHEEKCYNFMQLPYDSHEWDFASWYSSQTRAPAHKMNASEYEEMFKDKGKEEAKKAAYKTVARRIRHELYNYPEKCEECALRDICDGFKKQYLERFGGEEARPIKGKLIHDHLQFIKKQRKVVD